MDWGFVSHHLISGYIPVAALLVLYFILLRLTGKKQTVGHITVSFIFCLYLVGILTMTGLCLKGSFSPRIVYIPFVDMIGGPKDTFLNILLFIPMGVFLPILYERFGRIGRVAIAGFLISLSVEAAQMFGYGATDINDLITNTIGTCLGFGIFKLLCRAVPKTWIDSVQVEGAQSHYELMIFWTGSLLIMLTVQIHVFHAFYPPRMIDGDIQVWK